MIALQIARMIAHIVLFLELTDEESLHPDNAVDALEQLGADLDLLEKGFLRELIDAFETIAPDYGEDAQMVRDIPSYFDLREQLVEDREASEPGDQTGETLRED
jgi:hypothetical protein